jgi:ribosomal protein S12 methylthiotransferase accessory factor
MAESNLSHDVSPIYRLIQPTGGLFGMILRSRANRAESAITTAVAHPGNIEDILGNRAAQTPEGLSGCGTGLNEESALFLALAEGLERYCACIYDPDHFIVATGSELGSEALNLDEIARCSSAELANPKCPLATPDRNAPIRWVRGVSLATGKMAYIPVVMVYLLAGYATPAERFWLPISTGCAAHESYSAAVVSGILEVIERDALSIIWLQRCSIPEIDIDIIPTQLQPYWGRHESSGGDIRYAFFNATTDLGIPVIYCVQRAAHDHRVSTLVTCSCKMDPSEAIAKTICDMTALRLALRNRFSIPESWSDFHGLFHGAAYMARYEQQPVFDFLLKTPRRIRLSVMKPLPCRSAAEQLRFLLRMLQAHQLEAYAVDITADEALRCGVRVVRVVIPGLQPLSFNYCARYLGHQRLYDAPARMGYHTYAEDELNHWPQPFA